VNILEPNKTEHQISNKLEKSMSERFMEKVISEYGTGVGKLALTDFQKRLAQNYFISMDATFKTADEKRIKGNINKSANYQNNLPIVWANVNMELLARNVVSVARVGLDPAQKNHINTIPYKNNATQKYDIGFILGYRGIELQAKKYGLDIPDHIIIELVYSKDKFKSIKKDRNNPTETYDFEVVNDFDRGDIVGGFYYHQWITSPEKNKLVVWNLKEIEKRKPKYASAEFWGGEKDKWENGKKVGKEIVEGWYDDMCRKTIARAAYGTVTIDSQKIDDDYMTLKQAESAAIESEVAAEINVNANTETIDVIGQAVEEEQPEATPATQKQTSSVDQANDGHQKTTGPNF